MSVRRGPIAPQPGGRAARRLRSCCGCCCGFWCCCCRCCCGCAWTVLSSRRHWRTSGRDPVGSPGIPPRAHVERRSGVGGGWMAGDSRTHREGTQRGRWRSAHAFNSMPATLGERCSSLWCAAHGNTRSGALAQCIYLWRTERCWLTLALAAERAHATLNTRHFGTRNTLANPECCVWEVCVCVRVLESTTRALA